MFSFCVDWGALPCWVWEVRVAELVFQGVPLVLTQADNKPAHRIIVEITKSRLRSIKSSRTSLYMNKKFEDHDPTQNLQEIKAPFVEGEYDITVGKVVLRAGLYLVATPIGNLRDITIRALDVLKTADCIACEDTRMTGKLLSLLGIKQKLLPYHDHNADTQRPVILEKIKAGQVVALVSDAGMPLISDPGYKLVRDCADQNLYVTSLPGANAPLTALQLSALPSDHFSFLGFLPTKSKAKRDILNKWKSVQSTLILFEAGPRLEATCRDMFEMLGDRQMALTRELTKKFEEVWRGNISEVLGRLEREGAPKGEFVLVIDRGEDQVEEIDLDQLIVNSLELRSLKETVEFLVEKTGVPKKQIYNRALELKK
jgi:16S rRNA (cytidine1402-2'-O)-methyltransferase